MYDTIIVGGGISGLYTYMKLLDKGEENILLLEQEDYFGGRIKQINKELLSNKYSFPAGGARFNKNHTKVIKLLKKFNLIDFRTDKGFGAEIEFMDVKNEFSDKYHNKKGFDFIQKIIDKSKMENEQILRDIRFSDLAYKYLSKEDCDFMFVSCGYSGQLLNMNAYDAIKLFSTGIRTDITYWGGKFDKLIVSLVDYIKSHGGKLLLNKCVKNIDYNNKQNVFQIRYNNEDTFCRKLVLCLPKQALLKFSYLKPISCILEHSITCKPLCRTYAIFKKKDIWFKDLKQKIVTNNELRYIIPMNADTGLIMISYTDSNYTQYWKNIMNNKKKLKKSVVQLIYETFQIQVNEPYDVTVCYWDCGVGYWNFGVNSDVISNFLLNPLPNLYICGENYSQNQSWVEGALESVDKCMKKN